MGGSECGKDRRFRGRRDLTTTICPRRLLCFAHKRAKQNDATPLENLQAEQTLLLTPPSPEGTRQPSTRISPCATPSFDQMSHQEVGREAPAENVPSPPPPPLPPMCTNHPATYSCRVRDIVRVQACGSYLQWTCSTTGHCRCRTR